MKVEVLAMRKRYKSVMGVTWDFSTGLMCPLIVDVFNVHKPFVRVEAKPALIEKSALIVMLFILGHYPYFVDFYG